MYDVKPVVSKRSTACGASSLKMLLDYYGTDVPLEQLIDELNIRLVGCTGKDLLDVGRAHGLDMTAWRMDAEELMKQDRPCIVHWKQMHWIVFCGINERNQVVIANPSRGRFGLDAGTFAAGFSGTVLANGTPVSLEIVAGDNYENGQLFEQDGILYRALKAIARGEALSGSVERISVADVLNELSKESE